jgi:uncharacterized protein
MRKSSKFLTGFVLSDVLLWLISSPRFALKFYQAKVFETFGVRGPMEELLAFKEFENFPVFLEAVDGTVMQGWFYQGPGDKLFVYNMGRNSDIAKSLANARVMLAAGASVFTFEYRGFGSTAGKPSLKSICEDGLTAYDFARDQLGYDESAIIIYGESLGAGVASYVSDCRPAAGLVLQSGFASFEHIGKKQKKFLRIYPNFLFPRALNNEERVARAHPPLLVIHGEQDTFIPVDQAHRIFDAACPPRQLALLPNSHHRDMAELDWDAYLKALTGYLGRLPRVAR